MIPAQDSEDWGIPGDYTRCSCHGVTGNVFSPQKQTEFDLITVKDRPAWDAVCHMEGPNLPHIILMASCQAPGKPLEPR